MILFLLDTPMRNQEHPAYRSRQSLEDIELSWQLQNSQLIADQQLAIERLIQLSAPTEMIITTYKQFERRKIDAERKAFARMGRIGRFDALTTDTKSAKPVRWMQQHRRYFSAGRASTCLAVAVIHAEVGIGASHRTSVSPGDLVDAMVRTARDAQYAHFVEQMTRAQRIRLIVSQETLYQTVRVTVGEAIGEFLSVRRSKEPTPTENIVIIPYGLFYLDTPSAIAVTQNIEECVREHPAFRNTSSLTVSHVGHMGELRYGGPGHDLYSTPQFIEESSSPQLPRDLADFS